MIVKYIGSDFVALPHSTVCKVLAIENGWYRVMTELDETYLFPPDVFEIHKDERNSVLSTARMQGC